MPTVNDIIRRAYRKLSVTGIGNAMTAEEAEDGLTAFNMMLHEWKLRGVNTYHSDQGPNDTFALAPEYEEGTVYMLAKRLSPDFLAPAHFDADDWFRVMQTAYAEIDDVEMPLAITRTSSQRRYY